MRWVRVVLILGFIGSLGGLTWLYWQYEEARPGGVLIRGMKPKVQPDPVRYRSLSAELKKWQEDLGAKFKSAGTQKEKDEIAHDARVIFELVAPEMMKCWLGTGYDFNGTAAEPGEGKIACGYFVSTVLKDAGFRVNRYRLAQQPSGNIMQTFIPRKECRLRVGVDYEKYADWLEDQESGIYLIGLDTHVGFIVIEGAKVRFIHSSGIGKAGVVKENRAAAKAIQRSNWRLLGPLTQNRGFIEKWLLGEKLNVRKL